MKPLVIYHSPCMDGFTAAWACWLKHPDWEFFPGTHGDKPPYDLMTDRDVYMLDFSYPLPDMEKVINQSYSVTVLDHHKTAEANVTPLMEKKLVHGKFDMNHSGAYLAWEYFHGTEVPVFVLAVEDRDLWKFERPNSRELNAAFFSHEYDFRTWSALNEDCASTNEYVRLVEEGQAIERKHFKDIRELLEKIEHRRVIGGIEVSVANLPYTMASDGANLMALAEPFAATYFFNGTHYVLSLRSDEQGMDVSEIAKKYGGGGHKHSAGFQVKTLEEL